MRSNEWKREGKHRNIFATVEYKHVRCPYCYGSFASTPLKIIYRECTECGRCGKFLFIEEEHARKMSCFQL